jgi:hypothetical protein
MITTSTTAVFIVRILSLGSHYLELLSDGSVDIVDADIEHGTDYTHLNPEEARQLFPALMA